MFDTTGSGPGSQPDSRLDQVGPALDVLAAHSAQLVLFRLDLETGKKPPVRRGWRTQWPTSDEAKDHIAADVLHHVGIIPASLGMTALDVGQGDPAALVAAHPPLLHVASLTPGRSHLYYSDSRPRGNGHWTLHGCGGEIRSAAGYLGMYGDTPQQVVQVLLKPLAIQPPLIPPQVLRSLTRPGQRRPTGPAADVSHLQPGKRNDGLFDAVRLWAYREPRGSSWERWAAHVADQALGMAKSIPNRQGFDDAEVITIALSVARWTWTHQTSNRPRTVPAWFTHDSDAQRRRQVAQVQARHETREPLDIAICQLHHQGLSQREIAAQTGISQRSVGRSIQRATERTIEASATNPTPHTPPGDPEPSVRAPSRRQTVTPPHTPPGDPEPSVRAPSRRQTVTPPHTPPGDPEPSVRAPSRRQTVTPPHTPPGDPEPSVRAPSRRQTVTPPTPHRAILNRLNRPPNTPHPP